MSRVEQVHPGRYASRMNVGVAELKRRFGHYVKLLYEGRRIVICIRGVPIAELRTTSRANARRATKHRDPEDAWLARLAAEGVITRGRRRKRTKPFRPLRWRGKKTLSEMVIEDRGP
jgi:antitoxin (DNA-binding transcriptional repressor) of toxin-antitoxin stability system